MKDFRGTQGLVVRYSAHYRKQHPSMDWAYTGKLIGIVVDTHLEEERGVLVTYPIIAWENRGGIGSMCHPDNVVPYRKDRALPDLHEPCLAARIANSRRKVS